MDQEYFMKQSSRDVLSKKFSWKLDKIHIKTPVPEFFFLIKKETLAQVFSREFC